MQEREAPRLFCNAHAAIPALPPRHLTHRLSQPSRSCIIGTFAMLSSNVVDPDPESDSKGVPIIRIRICNSDVDPDPGGQNNPRK
jgi:hypothetical protein